MTKKRRAVRAHRGGSAGARGTRPKTIVEPASLTLAELEGYLTESGFLDELCSVAEGMLPGTPEEAFSEILAEAEANLASVSSPLDAELWGSEMLAIAGLGGIDLAAAEDLVTEAIVPMAESAGTEPALAMLVVMAHVGGPRLATAAQAARLRMVPLGIPEPVWAKGLGAPTVGPCWLYADYFGEQESVTLTFAYGRKRHALCVLIDHSLGGGVKDAYLCDRVAGLRQQMSRVAEHDLSYLEDVTPEDAAARLGRAVAAPECPRLPDQVEDVARTRALLRSRLGLISGRAAMAATLSGT